MWAFGCILWELITGQKLFSGDYAVLRYSLSAKDELLNSAPTEQNRMILVVFFVANFIFLDPRKRPSASHAEQLLAISPQLPTSVISNSVNFTWTMMEYLSRTELLDSVEAMLEANVTNLHGTGGQLGESILRHAVEKGRTTVVKQLLEAGVSENSIVFDAVSNGKLRIVQVLHASGCNLHVARNDESETLLHLAALKGQARVLKFLLAVWDGSISTAYTSRPYLTALHYAAVSGNPDVAELLLENGANMDERISLPRDTWDVTAVNIAALNGNVEILKVLQRYTDQDLRAPLEQLYDNEWKDRQRYWINFPEDLNRRHTYLLPMPLKRVGDDWYALFEPDNPGKSFDISRHNTLRLGNPISCLCFSEDGLHFAVVSGKILKVFETRSGNPAGELQLSEDPICIRFGFSDDGQDIIWADGSQFIRQWDLRTRENLRPYVHESQVASLDVCRSKGMIVATAIDGTVRLWTPLSPQFVALMAPPYQFHTAAISPTDKMIAAAAFQSDEHRICLWDPSGTVLAVINPELETPINILAFFPNGQLVVGSSLFASGSGSILEVWQICEGRRVTRSRSFSYERKACLCYRERIYGLACSPNNQGFAIVHESGKVELRNAQIPYLKRVVLHAHKKSSLPPLR